MSSEGVAFPDAQYLNAPALAFPPVRLESSESDG